MFLPCEAALTICSRLPNTQPVWPGEQRGPSALPPSHGREDGSRQPMWPGGPQTSAMPGGTALHNGLPQKCKREGQKWDHRAFARSEQSEEAKNVTWRHTKIKNKQTKTQTKQQAYEDTPSWWKASALAACTPTGPSTVSLPSL